MHSDHKNHQFFPKIVYDMLSHILQQSSKEGVISSENKRIPTFFKSLYRMVEPILRKVNIAVTSRDWYDRTTLIMDNQIVSSKMATKVCAGTIIDILQNPHDWNWLYENLADEQSKETLLKVVRLRIAAPFMLMAEAGKMLEFEYDYSRTKKEIERNLRILKWEPHPIYEISGYRLYGTHEALFEVFVMENYRYHDIVVPREGDLIIDGGAFTGDTAVWFIKYTGSKGKVFTFEPKPRNYEFLLRTIELNKLNKLVIPIKAGLWKSDGELGLRGYGAVATIGTGINKGNRVRAVSLDGFVKQNGIERVDFIKLDLEGAEIEALKGAQNVLRKFKPNLAIAAYHKPRDIVDISKYIKSTVPEYKLYLNHKWYKWYETVLFGSVRST